MSKKTGKLKRLLMAVGLSMLSICTLNQVADAALTGEVQFRKKTDVPTGKIRYQLKLNASGEGEVLEGLYVKGTKLGVYDATTNSIYNGAVSGSSAIVVVEVSTDVDTIQVRNTQYTNEPAGNNYSNISLNANPVELDNYGPTIKWICRGIHKDGSHDRTEVVELRAEDSTCIDKIMALNAAESEVDGETVITPIGNDSDGVKKGELAALGEGGNALYTVNPDNWSEESNLVYETSRIPTVGDPAEPVKYIRVYDILGNFTDLKAPEASDACTAGPKIKWAYKSEDKIWKSTALKEDPGDTNDMSYSYEEVNYVQFEAVDNKAVITKILDQQGKDRVKIDEKDQKDFITTMYKFKDRERYFFVENLFGYKTLVAIQPEYDDPQKTLGQIQTELTSLDNGYIYNETENANDVLVDVSYVVAAKNEDGSHVALSMKIPANTELLSLVTEEEYDLIKPTTSPVPTAKNEGEVRRGNNRLVATYEDVPVGTTHVDVTYGNKALVAYEEGGTYPIVPMGANEIPANLAQGAAIEIMGTVDLESLEYNEKVTKLASVEVGEGKDYPTYKDVPLYRRVNVPINTTGGESFESLVKNGNEEVVDLTYETHDGIIVENESVDDPRVIIPLGDSDFATLPLAQKVIVPLKSGETFANLSDNEKVIVPRDGDVPATGYKRINRDNTQMYKTDVKYDTTIKYDTTEKYDTTKLFATDRKYDINNKYDITHMYDNNEDPTVIGMIQVGLDLDLVEPKVVLRKNDDGSIVDTTTGASARVYRNKDSNATMAIIEVTDVVSGIAKIGAYPEVGNDDAATNLATAQKNYDDAVVDKAAADKAYDDAIEAKTEAERQKTAKEAAKTTKVDILGVKQAALAAIILPEDESSALYAQRSAEKSALEAEIAALEADIAALEADIAALTDSLHEKDLGDDEDGDGEIIEVINTAKGNKITKQTALNSARTALAAVEETYKEARKLFDIRGLPKSVVQLIDLDATNSKYIRVYDGIGNCNEIPIYDDNTDSEHPIEGITKIDGYRENGVGGNDMGLQLSLILDDDKALDQNGTQHVVQVDYQSSTVGMRSFVRAAEIDEARDVIVTEARKKAYGEKEFVKNKAYNINGNEEYLYETLQTSEDIAKCYPVEPQVGELKGVQLQGEPYCWAIDAFGNAAMYDLNKVLFKGGVGGDNDDTDHYVMMDMNDTKTTAISVKVEDLRRIKKIAAIIDTEEVTLETFEIGDTPSATGGLNNSVGPEDVDRVYEIGEGIVGNVIIYHTNDKNIEHQNVVKPTEVSSAEASRKQYVQLQAGQENGSYKATIKYGIKRVDYSDDTVIEFYDEIPKDVDIYLRGESPKSVVITDALGYTYEITEGDTAEGDTDLAKYPVHQAPAQSGGGE